MQTPNAMNSLCGYKIVTGQPSDRLGEDFSDQYKDFTERLSRISWQSHALLPFVSLLCCLILGFAVWFFSNCALRKW
ncbi:apoptosis inhibitor 5-like protein API5 [Magnolia sinica]|uniref:apoptosis inhibitor 5-like protein API5 n=1 Tax=Magnolia sinica TaxID=86752 RepID=UPI002657E92F|nr:apoptosis inhibitor 5-like protein API5 [Magnolia sinica]